MRLSLYIFLLFCLAPTVKAQEADARKTLRDEAQALETFVHSGLVKEWLKATDALPAITPRTAYRDEKTRMYYTEAEAAKLPDATRQALKKVTFDASVYYTTKYGSPLAYARPLDLLAASGLRTFQKKKILDFGYGTIGHLRLLASLGAEAVGVDVDPFLRVLYSEPGDTGVVKGVRGRSGKITLVDGHFPADETVKKAVGGNYDLILSKNTLKRGYVHPERPVDKRLTIDLGVDDERFVHTLYAILKPGGFVLIYNLCPAPAPPDKPYIPWADGRCPFPKTLWESVGFRVMEYDKNDDTAARDMAHRLQWDRGDTPMNLENDLFATYTLVQKPIR